LAKFAVLTGLFERGYIDCLGQSLQSWKEALGDASLFVICPEDLSSCVPEGAKYIKAVNPASYGACYSEAIASLPPDAGNHILIVAPYCTPSDWLVGSLLKWIEHYDLIGIYRPPRFLHAPMGTTILELGRLNMDFVCFSRDLAIVADFGYHEWNAGQLLVRVRPGGQFLFNALTFGAKILTLPQNAKPISYLSRDFRRERFMRNRRLRMEMQIREFKGRRR